SEAEEIITRFQLSEAAADVVRHKLKGPDENGSGSPFPAIIDADQVRYEQMLVNSLGPVELWALSTTPTDVALRNRLYERIGFSEGLRRLSRVFQTGTAKKRSSAARMTASAAARRRAGRRPGSSTTWPMNSSMGAAWASCFAGTRRMARRSARSASLKLPRLSSCRPPEIAEGDQG
ncbi:MAG: hypothetical protein ACRYG8_16450, partial [Janthinobacterium lividum]